MKQARVEYADHDIEDSSKSTSILDNLLKGNMNEAIRRDQAINQKPQVWT